MASLVFCQNKNTKMLKNKVKLKSKYDNLFVTDPIGKADGLALMQGN